MGAFNGLRQNFFHLRLGFIQQLAEMRAILRRSLGQILETLAKLSLSPEIAHSNLIQTFEVRPRCTCFLQRHMQNLLDRFSHPYR